MRWSYLLKGLLFTPAYGLIRSLGGAKGGRMIENNQREKLIKTKENAFFKFSVIHHLNNLFLH